MKILMVTRPIGEPWNEGGKNLAYNLAKNIKNNKINLLAKNDFNIKLKNVHLEKTFSSSNKRKISFLDKLRLFIRLISKDDLDCYHFIFTPELYSSLFSRFILTIKNKKSIQTIPTLIRDKKFIKYLIFADKIVVLSDYTKKFLANRGFNNIIKINPGVDTNFFKPGKKDLKLKNKLNLKNKFVVLIPGELEKKRGTRVILKSIINQHNPEELFFIFAYRKDNNNKHLKEKKVILSTLNKYKINNFVFLEDFSDIKNLINIADIIAYPVLDMNEKQEIPMILLECLAMKKPIIITDMVPLNEIIKSYCGKKIKKNDSYKLSQEILNLKNNKKLRLKMGENGRKMVIKYFNIIETAKEYEKLYSSI